MKRQKKRNQGLAMPSILVMILVMTALVGIMSRASLQRVFSAGRLCDRTRALAYAEAGANEAYSVLCTNWALRSNEEAFPKKDFHFGTYDATVVPVDSTIAVIKSTGTCADETVEVILDVKNFGGSSPGGPPEGSAWECTIFAEEEVYINGNGDVDGAIHGNLQVRFNGNLEITPGPIHVTSATKIRVNGNALTPGSLTAPSIKITGNNESGIAVNKQPYPTIPFPELDLAEFYDTAVDNGQVKAAKTYNNDIDWSGAPGGVVWIPGNVRFKGNCTFDGILVATGSVRMEGNTNWDTPEGKAGTIISRDSFIKINGNVECDALLYSPGKITLGGNVRLEGQIISGNDVDINGNVEVVHYGYVNPSAGSDGSNTDIIGPTAWQK
ncbi:MAG: hypothetical protein QGI24_09135 [Kiritimatiellia bacterium]|jgi:hypothetical protein|nr:hypothetical protein [Kiritimatiellia bacterium]MDP6848937.1 hypothetical protein [Kiritimatiellia bacterium]